VKRCRPDDALLAEWLGERCVVEAGARGNARELWLDWLKYACGRGAEPGSPRSFSNEMRKLGHPRERKAPGYRTCIHAGVRLPPRPLARTPWGEIII
jgi:hypothetical protein